MSNLAFLQATCPDDTYRDGEKAVINAKRACQLDGEKQPRYLDTLAAAYAEDGDFEKAVKWQEKALEKASDETIKKRYRSRLELYRQGKPYRKELKKK